MILTLDLPTELELRLNKEAARRRIAPQSLVIETLSTQLPSSQQTHDAVGLLQSWMNADDAPEQQATGEFLVQALDEDRLSNRQLFPPELKGRTW